MDDAKSKHLKWVVVFDSNVCRIYGYSKDQIVLIKEIQHPENKLRDIDLTSDKPGRYQAKGYVHGAYTQESDPKAIKIDNFSKEIANILDHGRNTHAYETLILGASSHMNGLLLKHLNKQVKSLITHNIEKNLMPLGESELLVHLNEVIKKRF